MANYTDLKAQFVKAAELTERTEAIKETLNGEQLANLEQLKATNAELEQAHKELIDTMPDIVKDSGQGINFNIGEEEQKMINNIYYVLHTSNSALEEWLEAQGA